jgi:hypothetical protein
MKKFSVIAKEKAEEHNILQENKVLDDFKKIYGAMLEHYGLTAIHDLDEDSQLSFLTELNHYWSEEGGLSEKGNKFLQKRSMNLNENSTAVQKKNFLKDKSYAVINETLRQTDLKFRLYDVIDQIYHETNASNLKEVLSPDMITSIITESFVKSLNEFTENINKELKESVESIEPKKKYFVKVKTK